ncbi:MAG: ComEC/Rec2 family competence protein, partial [Ruminococcus sp.]|nr:ComEC/Rec2 family competence protein [Ruminococcus sp.]
IAASAGFLLKLRFKRVRAINGFIAIGITVLCAALSMTAYTSFVYSETDSLAESEIEVGGYICEEITRSGRLNYYTVQTDTIDGKPNSKKLLLTSYRDYGISEFENLSATLTVHKTGKYYIGKGIFLSSFGDDIVELKGDGSRRFSLYANAVSLRKSIKRSLDFQLSDDSAALCRGILLGDKKAIDKVTLSWFYDTGSTFLIVVSGMHLSIAVGAVMLFLRRITKSSKLIFIVTGSFILLFAAVTGFSPSVIRASVVTVIAYFSPLVLRRADGINSLGFAALVLTLPNPYAAGDDGLLLSFAATFGILLWADKISRYICSRLKIENKFIAGLISAVSVTISASLWVAPLSVLFFGKLSPVVVFVALICELPVSAVLVCAMLAGVLKLIPVISFLAFPFAFAAEYICRFLRFVLELFALLPFSSVRADKSYFYIWIIVTALLVAVGYIIKARGFYIRCAVALSAAALGLGWAVSVISELNSVTLTVLNDGYGYFVTLKSGGKISFLSVGGRNNSLIVADELNGNYSSVDYCVIPAQIGKYFSGLPGIYDDYEFEEIFVYDSDKVPNKKMAYYYSGDYMLFGKNCEFDVILGAEVRDRVINVSGSTFQFLTAGDKTFL